MGRVQIGEISKAVVDTLELDVKIGTPIYIGESNLHHMERRHPRDYKKYAGRISRIISDADWVCKNDDGSIEYVKKFGQFVNVAVRISVGGDFYVRTLFHVEPNLANNRIKKGRWKRLSTVD